jgi:transposase-like protein
VEYLYRAVDKTGNTGNFLLAANWDRKAALRFLCRAIGQHSAPAKITIDKSTANTVATENYNSEHNTRLSSGRLSRCSLDREKRRLASVLSLGTRFSKPDFLEYAGSSAKLVNPLPNPAGEATEMAHETELVTSRKEFGAMEAINSGKL